MNPTEMLSMMKIDLGITTNAYDARLAQTLQIAEANIKGEGAVTLNPSSSLSDANLVLMYAEWLWRRRDSMITMPRMLRWQLNNRVFREVRA